MTQDIEQDSQEQPQDQPQGDIVAKAANYYRMTRYIMVAMLIGMGAWFAYDGWIGWPEQNRQFQRLSTAIDAAQSAGAETIDSVIHDVSEIDGIGYATISVGEVDKIAKGMIFTVIDKDSDQFLGMLTIDSTEANESTGRLSGPRITEVRSGTKVRMDRPDLIEQRKEYSEHGPWDIFFQKLLGVTLPPLGVFTLFWALYNSRGQFRLSGQTLDVPGHGAVNFDQIRRLDKKLWDRKGIAYIDYEPSGGGELQRFKLDDFVYERKPIDEIYNRIDKYVAPPQESGEEPPQDSAG